MKYKILIPNSEDGRFYFTKEQLEELLDKTYNEGYEEGKKAGDIQYVPYPQISNPREPYQPYNPLNPYVTWMGPNDVPPSFSSINNRNVKYSTGTTTGKG